MVPKGGVYPRYRHCWTGAGGLIRKAPLTGEMPEGLLYQRRNKISAWRKLSRGLCMPKIYGAS